VAPTYADERHDFLLTAGTPIPPGAGLRRSAEGWRRSGVTCARASVEEGAKTRAARFDLSAVPYAFVGLAVDSALVSADADLAPLLGVDGPATHQVRLVAVAFARDLAPPAFRATPSLVASSRGDTCACGDATHFAASTKVGALLSYDFQAPRSDAHVRALDFVRAALGAPRLAVHETRLGGLALEGLDRALAGTPEPLLFHLTRAVPLALEATSLTELCDFPAPEISPSPLDFGVAPYGTEARRTVHVVNRSPVDLQALLGASTFALPARGAIDLPLHWTPDGDAPGCETQTRDEIIPFLRAGRDPSRTTVSPLPRTARVLETVRTGRPSVERVEPITIASGHAEPPSANDWTCPKDFVRASCSATRLDCGDGGLCDQPAENVQVELRGANVCHFSCRDPGNHCRFTARMTCAIRCTL
jgi:hypothetical protein